MTLPQSSTFLWPQRAFAARWAISLRSSGESFFALAIPPFLLPNFPRATAAGFFGLRGNCNVFRAGFKGSPIAASTTLSAFCATSPLLARPRMSLLLHGASTTAKKFKTAHYPRLAARSMAQEQQPG